VLVTGGAGYIGSHTARYLLQNGFEVVTLDNLSTGHKEFVSGTFIEGDLADPDLLERVFSEHQFDAVVHFAASIEVEESMKRPEKYYANNVVNGLNLLAAMVNHGVNNIVFSSTCVVYDEKVKSPVAETALINPTSTYGETKLVFENALKWFAPAYGINSIALRYFNAAGASLDATLGYAGKNPTHLIPNVLNVALGRKDSLTVFGNDYCTQDGTAVRDYIHVLDLAEAHRLSLDFMLESHAPVREVFNVGTGKGYSVLEVINAVCERTGHMVKFEIGPRREGDRELVVADACKIGKILGFKPKYSDLDTIIDTAWAWHKKYFGGR
jgi:UDP-glucose 4-epimerase